MSGRDARSTGGPLRLGIDLDGVVADFNSGWIERFNRDFGADLHPSEVVHWDAPIHLTHFADIDEFWGWFRHAGDGRSIFAELEPYADAVDTLHRLGQHGHHLVILTTKPDFAIAETYGWLARHNIASREVHLLDVKADVQCDIYLDDADHNLATLIERRPEAVTCRFVRPWNRPHDSAVDIEHWHDFERLISEHSHNQRARW